MRLWSLEVYTATCLKFLSTGFIEIVSNRLFVTVFSSLAVSIYLIRGLPSHIVVLLLVKRYLNYKQIERPVSFNPGKIPVRWKRFTLSLSVQIKTFQRIGTLLNGQKISLWVLFNRMWPCSKDKKPFSDSFPIRIPIKQGLLLSTFFLKIYRWNTCLRINYLANSKRHVHLLIHLCLSNPVSEIQIVLQKKLFLFVFQFIIIGDQIQ